jgi:signal transduction histidine kinase/DNA-binding NarL/FixJ family response regulator
MISYRRITESVSGLKNRIKDDVELNAIKNMRNEFENIDNMLQMYLITHNRFYLGRLDSSVYQTGEILKKLKKSVKLSQKSVESLDSMGYYTKLKSKNIAEIIRFQQDVSIEKLIDDYLNMQSIRNADENHERSLWSRLKLRNKSKKKIEKPEKTIPETEINIEKQDIVQMAEADNINPYLEKDHVINIRYNSISKALERNEIDRIDHERRQTERSIESANESIMVLGILTSVFILLAGIVYFRYIKRMAEIGRQLTLSKEQAEELTLIKERFMANMSHEIRTPLNAISGFIDQLQEDGLSKDKAHQAELVTKSIQHILNIINDILDFSKLKAGKLSLEQKGFKAAETIRQAAELLIPLIKKPKTRLIMNISKNMPEVLIGDAYRLRQILLNILGNSIKYTESGTIELSAGFETKEDGKSYLNLNVTDTGIGIDASELSNIFNEFHMAGNARWSKAGSTGLGLSITKMLVELFHGNISIESRTGSGTSVKIQLPMYEGTASDVLEEISYNPDETNFLRNKVVLVADDEPFNRDLIKKILQKFEVQILEAENGQVVMDILKDKRVDCILMDIKMPVMNGIESTEALRNSEDKSISDIPVVAVSAALTDETLDKLSSMGVDKSLEKPFRENELLRILHDIFGGDHPPIDVQDNNDDMGPPDSPSGFDITELQRQSNGDSKFVEEMLKTLLESTSDGLNSIKNSIQSKEKDSIHITSHRIASPLRYIKADTLYKSIKLLENQTDTGVDTDFELLLKTYETAKRQFYRLKRNIQDYMNSKII